MDDMNIVEELAKVEVTRGPDGFRAVSVEAGVVGWACKHVHFTDRSARNCAELYARTAGRGIERGRP
jgi:hypothetical protein